MGVGESLFEAYSGFISTLPAWTQNFITLFLLTLVIVIYSVFIWKFYRFLSTKNILGLNLKRFNKVEHPFFTKLVSGTLSFIEYIIILPFLIFFWFSVFTIFLIFLTNQADIQTILIISATVIAAIRMTSYIPGYGQNLAKEIAKLLPFTLLAVSVLNPDFFSIQRITGQIAQLPDFFSQIMIYLLFIVILEIIMRFFEFIFQLLGMEDPEPVKD